MDDSSTQDSQPSSQPKDAPDTEKPFDPDTLPPQLRAALDHLSDLRYEMMALIVRRRAEQATHRKEATVRREAEAAEAARAAAEDKQPDDESQGSPSS